MKVEAINTNLRYLATNPEVLDYALDDIFTVVSRLATQHSDQERALRRIGGETYHSDGTVT